MRALHRDLSKIDPAEAWSPWQPSASDPWDRKWAAHLYRRAAFGPSRADLIEAERLGPHGTLDLLFRGRPSADEMRQSLNDIGRVAASQDDGGEQLRGWWLYVILHCGHPLREKLTLFWHNHFATSIVKVRNSDLMFRQNCLLRDHALGKFGPMLHAISRDGAMLLWLDSNRNVVGQPNENYARELMELFSLGVGNYTEPDVREAARAFTGWHTSNAGFTFQPRLHDDGSKTVLTRTGNWSGDDILRIVLDQPAAARFLVRKLYRYFISESADPPDTLLAPLADSFRTSNYDIAALVRTMLSSRHFYSEHAFRQRVKSPVEFVVGAINTVCRSLDPDQKFALPQQALVSRLTAMGQPLFAPPNVKGWPGGRAWLNTATMLERDNFAAALSTGSLWTTPPQRTTNAAMGAMPAAMSAGRNRSPSNPPSIGDLEAPPAAFDPARIAPGESSVEYVVHVLLDTFQPGGARPEVRARLAAYLRQNSTPSAIREAVHAIMTTPEYQLA
jgi:uncharacterized protein (DUF1800 family)